MNTASPRLTPENCRHRQAAVVRLIQRQRLDGMLTCNRHYVHALTGYWHEQSLTPVAVLIEQSGETTLVSPGEGNSECVDQQLVFDAHKQCTIVEDPQRALAESVQSKMASLRCVGTTDRSWPWLLPTIQWQNIANEYQQVRRTKLTDETTMLRFAIAAVEAVYAKAREVLEVGLDEVQMYAELQATATCALGEPLSGWGQDFQIGSPGGFPRSRRGRAGELAILDIGVGYRGYRCDLSRTFAVTGEPTNVQLSAHARVVDALTEVESCLGPELSCRDLYQRIHRMLHGWNNYRFEHHLGHGIGLDAHEVPRVNPHWNDVLQPGDVIAIEPGLYGDELQAGIRLEQNYLITSEGFERLSHFPLDL